MRRILRLSIPFLAAAWLLFALAGCGSSGYGKATAPATGGGRYSTGATAAGGGAASAAPGTVTIKNFAFSPTPLAAKTGATITINNNDSTDHTSTDSGGAFDTGRISPGTSKTVTITTAGTYHYHCNIHQSMTGILQVSA